MKCSAFPTSRHAQLKWWNARTGGLELFIFESCDGLELVSARSRWQVTGLRSWVTSEQQSGLTNMWGIQFKSLWRHSMLASRLKCGFPSCAPLPSTVSQACCGSVPIAFPHETPACCGLGRLWSHSRGTKCNQLSERSKTS